MADKSNIEWTDSTWNPIVGCSIVSPGCTNCYAMKMAHRIERMNYGIKVNQKPVSHYDGTTKRVNDNAVWTGKVALAPDHILTAPLRWKRGRKIFVNSMGDLFHESIPDEWIDRVFAVMALCPQHTSQVLTKRAKRMMEYFLTPYRHDQIGDIMIEMADIQPGFARIPWPLPNVWLGVSTERQQEADERIPLLRATPSAVRFISFEPLLSHIEADLRGIHWAIVGGESGSGARLMHPKWARRLRNICAEQGVKFFFKQWGEFAPVEVTVAEWLNQKDPRYLGEWIVADSGEFVGFPCDGGKTCHVMRRLGKKRAGRLLDGKEHNAFPQAKEVVS